MGISEEKKIGNYPILRIRNTLFLYDKNLTGEEPAPAPVEETTVGESTNLKKSLFKNYYVLL